MVYTPDEIAKVLKITKKTVYKLIKNGELPVLQVGSLFRITDEQLQLYLSRKR